jgi:hypothetical protein
MFVGDAHVADRATELERNRLVELREHQSLFLLLDEPDVVVLGHACPLVSCLLLARAA